MVLKTCSYYQWTEDKIEVLLTYAEADILDHYKQATAFSLLKVISFLLFVLLCTSSSVAYITSSVTYITSSVTYITSSVTYITSIIAHSHMAAH